MSIYSSKTKSVNNTDMTSATQRAQKHMKNGRFSSLGLPSSCRKRRYLKLQGKQAAHRAQQLQHLRAAAAFFLLGSPWERHCRHRVGGVMPSRSGDCGEKVFLVLQHPRLCFLLFPSFLLAEESRGVAVLPPGSKQDYSYLG